MTISNRAPQAQAHPQAQPQPHRQRAKRPPSFADFIIQFRWLFVIPVLLPASFLFYQYVRWRAAVRAILHGPPTEQGHAARVAKVQARVAARAAASPTSPPGLICTARRAWLGISIRSSEHKRAGARKYPVDLGGLSSIIWVDPARRLIRCEPMVTMSEVSAATLRLGLAPAVLPELDDLTVGGVINGYGIEGSSHVYGLFAETCAAMELVLADGSLVRATPENRYADLFRAVPWSHGSLGLLVAVEFRLIPVHQYMRVTYQPVRGSLRDVAAAFKDSFCPRDMDQDNKAKVPEFVEGIVYSDTAAVITTGRYATKEDACRPGNVINNLGWWFKPSFHKHAETALTRGKFVEYVPVRQYYHRHTRSLYWEGELVVPMGNHPLFRFLLGWLMPPKVSMLKLTTSPGIQKYYQQRHACQDMLVPNHKLEECLEFCHENFETYPLWLCPHRLFKTEYPTMLEPEPGYELNKQPGDTDYAQMWCDVGIWGVPGPVLRKEVWDGAEATREMEQWLVANSSYQCLYAVIEQTEEEFWSMFNPTLYEQVRQKYGAEGVFMDVYYKVSSSRKDKAHALAPKKCD